jgi:hypothetical protein
MIGHRYQRTVHGEIHGGEEGGKIRRHREGFRLPEIDAAFFRVSIAELYPAWEGRSFVISKEMWTGVHGTHRRQEQSQNDPNPSSHFGLPREMVAVRPNGRIPLGLNR